MISYIVVGVPLDHRYIVVKGLTTVQDNITILWIDLKTYVKQNEKEPQANIRTQNYQFFEFSTQKIEVKLLIVVRVSSKCRLILCFDFL